MTATARYLPDYDLKVKCYCSYSEPGYPRTAEYCAPRQRSALGLFYCSRSDPLSRRIPPQGLIVDIIIESKEEKQ